MGMKPYVRGRNKALAKWRRAGLFGKVFLYLKPFIRDVLIIWLLGLPFPTSLKFILTVIALLLLISPMMYFPFALLATVSSVQMVLDGGSSPENSTGRILNSIRQYLQEPISDKDAKNFTEAISDSLISISSALAFWDYVRVFRDIV